MTIRGVARAGCPKSTDLLRALVRGMSPFERNRGTGEAMGRRRLRGVPPNNGQELI